MLISPVIALLFLAVSKDLGINPAAPQQTDSTHARCPACAEFVLVEAKVCKHCGSPLPWEENLKKKTMQDSAKAEADAKANKTFWGLMGLAFLAVIFMITH
jgi:hypothetical protein